MVSQRRHLSIVDDDACAIDLEREGRLRSCGALADYWYVACLSRELTTTKPLARTILDTPIALFRDAHGAPQAVVDRCLHRGAALSAGVVIDGQLCCPYHGWTYNAQGACVNVPSLGPQQRGSALDDAEHGKAGLKLKPADVGCLRRFSTCEQDGLVYVFLGADVAQARKPPFRVPYVDDPAWNVYFMVTPFDNGVTNLVENFMDVPHTVFVHQGWFRTPRQQRVPAVVERGDESVVVTYQQDQDRISGLGFILNPHREPMVHTDAWYAPNITRVDYLFGSTSGFVINSQCTPIGPMSSMVYTAISYKLPVGMLSKPVGRVLEPLIHWYTRQVITQDTEIMQLQKRGLDNEQRVQPGPVQFASTEADLLHADIERWRRYLLNGAVGEPPEAASRSIEFWI
jgi:phenylpropionate dioxygenase-like ring-hydroxylating dioxygenase large terminal subunit